MSREQEFFSAPCDGEYHVAVLKGNLKGGVLAAVRAGVSVGVNVVSAEDSPNLPWQVRLLGHRFRKVVDDDASGDECNKAIAEATTKRQTELARSKEVCEAGEAAAREQAMEEGAAKKQKC